MSSPDAKHPNLSVGEFYTRHSESLQMKLLGPTVGAFITILLAECLRIGFGTGAVGWDNIIYGSLLVVFIIFLPQGLVGTLQARLARTQPA